MVERLRIGSVDCDFMSPAEFMSTCRQWLQSETFHHVVTLNAEMVVQAEHDLIFRQAIQAATVRVPEGGPLWARAYLQSPAQAVSLSLAAFTQQRIERLTGVDMVWQLASLAARHGQSVYVLGGTAMENEGAAAALREAIPGLSVVAAPLHVFDMAGPQIILEDINAHHPAILLAAYGAPRQSVWIETHKHALSSVRIAVGVGGALAMISGQLPRAPRWLRAHNLEWVWRLGLQPQRWPRIWQAVITFPALIHQQKTKVGKQ